MCLCDLCMITKGLSRVCKFISNLQVKTITCETWCWHHSAFVASVCLKQKLLSRVYTFLKSFVVANSSNKRFTYFKPSTSEFSQTLPVNRTQLMFTYPVCLQRKSKGNQKAKKAASAWALFCTSLWFKLKTWSSASSGSPNVSLCW